MSSGKTRHNYVVPDERTVGSRTLSERYWEALTDTGWTDRPDLVTNRAGHSFWHRYWTSLLGIRPRPADPTLTQPAKAKSIPQRRWRDLPVGVLLATAAGVVLVVAIAGILRSPASDPVAVPIPAIEIGDVGTSPAVLNPTGRIVAVGTRIGDIQGRDAANGQLLDTFTGLTTPVTSVAFSPDGTWLVAGAEDGTLSVWNVTTNTLVGVFTGHIAAVTAVAVGLDGGRIVSTGVDGTVRLWDFTDPVNVVAVGRPWTGHGDAVTSVAFSPDGTRIVSGSLDHTVRLWDAATGQQIGNPLTGNTNGVTSVAFSPDGTRIVSGSLDHTVRLWGAATGRPIGDPLTGHAAGVTSVVFSPDGTLIASTGLDHTMRLWDADTGHQVGAPFEINGIATSVVFSPDGRTARATNTHDGALFVSTSI